MSNNKQRLKSSLASLLSDTAVMAELGNSRETLESAKGSPGAESLDLLIEGNGDVLRDGAYTTTEAIILDFGRPALIVQDGKWQTPKSKEIETRLKGAEATLLAAIPKVGRVEILNYRSDYVGTGWMIDEDILITNRHVASLFGQKSGGSFSFRASPSGRLYESRTDFLREYQRNAVAQAAVREIIYIEEDSDLLPDMALVRMDKNAIKLPAPVELAATLPVFDQQIAIIGYPAEDSRNDSFVMNDIFGGVYNVKRLSPGRIMGVRPDGKLLQHDGTTLGGNSGSPVIDLATGKAVGLHFSGSFHLENYAVTSVWLKQRLAEISPVRITVPALAAPTPPAGGPPEATVAAPVPNGGSGYHPDFLGTNGTSVPLPTIPEDQTGLIAPVEGNDDGELKYSHFSIVMRSDRRLPFYTAVNIDGNLLYNFNRGTDKWYYDDRISRDHQIGEDLYVRNNLDRGHLVRRLDPTWGESRKEAKQAEEETFFFTNCSPQHSKLNQKTWLSLEDYILGNAGKEKLQASVFSGPVMDENDRDYRGVQIPEEFWKVVVIVNPLSGKLSATGYVLSQADYLGDLEFVFGEFKTYQVPISQIEGKTGLSFDLEKYDPLARTEARPQREINGPADLIL
ncbi:DNA/RNA non-specific endonuclease [Luteolibacter ambystomatis]|uniref:DNA/RNA non-specific endonuclease n=1 Tax=Luteolibacter ambystomatis TaxID=2824561 RepID=A0A975J388_9BACT|nr:DNA/RNA non-specific endonuclease [Luteolibacter ambystomatis]QUE53162.1 DNA/RNA non-specific endonuclease [Luteolibacter ambystomatis]